MADQSGGSATSFRTAGVAYRLATVLQPPTTDAAGPGHAACRWVNQAPADHRRTSSAQPDSQAAASRHRQRLVFQLASADSRGTLVQRHGERGRRVPPGVIVRRPLVALALVPRPLMLFMVGGVAGAIGKTITAPLDRVKILLQVVIPAIVSHFVLFRTFLHGAFTCE